MCATATAEQTQKHRWLLRPQFSLRTFLLAVTAIGIGFPAWYRWPYETSVVPSQEKITDPYCGFASYKDPDWQFGRVTKTWQRQFGGPPLPDGWCRKYDRRGQLEIEEEYRAGRPHGIYRRFYSDGRIAEEGQYVQGLKEGIWTQGVETDGRRGPMRNSRRHGEWISWQDGQTTRVMFNEGRVIAVEGVAVDRTFEKEFPGFSVVDGGTFRTLLDHSSFVDAGMSLAWVVDAWSGWISAPVFLDNTVDSEVVVNGSWDDLRTQSDALLIVCTPLNLTPVYRYGGICLVPSDTASEWSDPTGVSGLRPATVSTVAAAWDQPVDVHADNEPLTKVLQDIADSLAISLDVTAIESDQKESDTCLISTYLKEHPFHHTLAYLLYKTHCRCRLDGDTLVILPLDETRTVGDD